MEKEKLFLRFLTLAKRYFKEEQSTDFYAEHLGVTPEELSTAILEISARNPSDWLKDMQKIV